MKFDLPTILSLLSITFVILNFAFSRKDKAVKETKDEEADKKLINYRLDELTRKVDKILDKLDKYDNEINDKIKIALDEHIGIYHKGE